MVLSLNFTAFDILPSSTCPRDHLTIIDGDGTMLMEKSCGKTLPANITSTSNIVNLMFFTDIRPPKNPKTGWSVSWSVVTPGNNIPRLFVQFFLLHYDG